MLPKGATDLHPPWGDVKLVVRAIGMSHEACKKRVSTKSSISQLRRCVF